MKKRAELTQVRRVGKLGREVIRNRHEGGLEGSNCSTSQLERKNTRIILLSFHVLFWVFVTFYNKKNFFKAKILKSSCSRKAPKPQQYDQHDVWKRLRGLVDNRHQSQVT